ncbi:MAG: hypothetical protein WBL20_17085 [Sphingobium sp.]|uniref:DUF7146 domain-containing protein n=1 Tax=Sphingobium sp. TaxID=1912891 RepID=UPI003BAE6327
MNGGTEISVGEIAQMIAPHASAVCRQILPAGREEGGFYCVGSIDGEPGASLKVYLKGARQGRWRDYAGDDRGDLVELVTKAAYGGDKAEAVKWCKAFLGIGDLSPGQFKAARRKAIDAAERQQREQGEEDAKKRRQARAMWLAGEPIEGTPGQYYLEARGIDFALLGHFPGSLRYGRVYHSSLTREAPCLMAAIMRDGKHIATHRTWITRDSARGEWRTMKRELGKLTKMTLGRYYEQGGYIPLWKGLTADGDIPSRAFEPIAMAGPVHCAEGIEDVLTIAQVKRELPAAAAVALANMRQLPFGHIIWIADRDADNEKAVRLLENNVAAQQAMGKRVQFIWPAEGFKDVNDQLLGKRMGNA